MSVFVSNDEIKIYSTYKAWDEITYLFLNFLFGNGYVISPHTLVSIWLHIHAEIKVKPFRLNRPQLTP